MRHFTYVFILVGWLGISRAFATPFEPATIPDQAAAIGHLDVDALRRTQLFTAIDGQKAIDAAVDHAPADLRPLARSIAGSVRSVSFWRDTEHGAVHVATRDPRALAQLIAKAPLKRGPVVEGVATLVGGELDDHGFGAVVGDTLILADTSESLASSIRTLAGKGPNLAGSNKLPATSRTGVFVFVTLGSDALRAIHKSADAKLLKLAIRSLAIDVSESGGVLTTNARADMGSNDALLKAKSIIDGMRALASVSADGPVRALLDQVTVTTNGLALELVARAPVAELAKLIASHK